MKLISAALGCVAGLIMVAAFSSYFIYSRSDNRGVIVAHLVEAGVIVALLAFISTFFTKQSHVNITVRRFALFIIVPVLLFIAFIYLAAWWLGRGLTV